MTDEKKIKTALISVFHKDGMEEMLEALNANGVKFLSTGGTQQFIETLGYECQKVESVTTYPSILGGRVKTLHPKVFGGILARRDNEGDRKQVEEYDIPEIDLVVVDLYPFEDTVAAGASEQDIIEKIDIGGISLIRAAAKNFNDVVIVPSKAEYGIVTDIIRKKGAVTTLAERRMLATRAFGVTSHYDTAIHGWFDKSQAE
ncbi:MAG: IMP cyclohydrolase [Prevotella sp.]|nr:IMP cyclohydrolase [Prevotella sp.]MBQ4295868.1 IMP cyclohydrolase [Prevotella sp.]MBR7053444.1 IMP cyclohydrolase [Prevotella sp.]